MISTVCWINIQTLAFDMFAHSKSKLNLFRNEMIKKKYIIILFEYHGYVRARKVDDNMT
jgi:hypothetical protein